METVMRFKGGIFLAGILLLFSPGRVLAHGTVPPSMAALMPGRVISVMESDFLVPQGFRNLPGPMFYLNHAKELGLTAGQREGILRIARTIMPKTIREGQEIDRLKREVVRLSDPRTPFREARLRRLLLAIGKKEGQADLAHIRAHRDCLRLLTSAQRRTLPGLLGKP